MRYLRVVVLTFILTCAVWAKPLVVAHRGGVGLGPENALETFEKAIALGVDAIELDIHQSRDGHLVVIHDISLKRTHGHSGEVHHMSLEQLKKAGVPTLQEVITLAKGRCRLFVEIKHPKDGTRHQGIEERLLKVLEANSLLETSVVISFDRTSVQRLHELNPEVETGYLFSRQVPDLKKLQRDLGVSYIGPHYRLASESLISRAHRLGLKVNTWTVNEPKGMRALIDTHCDAITTNHPDRLLAELESPAEQPLQCPSSRR